MLSKKALTITLSFIIISGSAISLTRCQAVDELARATGNPELTYLSQVGTALTNVFETYSHSFTPVEEYYIGRTVAAHILGKNRDNLYGQFNTPLEIYVQQIGQTLALASDRPETFLGYRFVVLKSESVNAYAVPSGYIFLTTGLIKLAETEDEIAGVLAHEVSHVVWKHPTQSIEEAKRQEAIKDLNTAVFADSGFGALMEEIFGDVINNVFKGYSAEKEEEADIQAVHLLIRAGYDPQGLYEMLKRLKVGGGVHGDPMVRAKRVNHEVMDNYKAEQVPQLNMKRHERFKKIMTSAEL